MDDVGGSGQVTGGGRNADVGASELDFWYAQEHTRVVRPPTRALETFGATRVNYHLLAELPDDPRKIRIREGRLEAHKPEIITPEKYAQDELEGFGEAARAYYEFLKQNEDKIKILQYGYCLKQEAYSEQVVTDRLEAVTERVVREVNERNEPFDVVLEGVDEPWDVCLMKFFWLQIKASAPVNVNEFRKHGMMG